MEWLYFRSAGRGFLYDVLPVAQPRHLSGLCLPGPAPAATDHGKPQAFPAPKCHDHIQLQHGGAVWLHLCGGN